MSTTTLTTVNQMFKDYFTKYSFRSFCRDKYSYNVCYIENMEQPHINKFLDEKWEQFKKTPEYQYKCAEVAEMFKQLTLGSSNLLLKSIPKEQAQGAIARIGLPSGFWKRKLK